jgi:acyl-coenzyme A thioesterase PaaI-like protein
MPTLHEFLRADQQENNGWRFHIPVELHGAFGGSFGGVLAACTLVAARSAAPGRVPNALDCRFVRGLVAGDAVVRTTVLHAGRSLATVSVDLFDERERLCTHAVVSLVDPTILYAHEAGSREPGDWSAHDDATPFPAVAPIVDVIDPRMVGSDDRGFATSARVPWDDEGHSAEAASMAADMAVGAPLGAMAPRGVRTPNPDLSLRFCGEVTTRTVVGLGRLDRASGGVAAIGIEVYSSDKLVATGISTALLLPPA